MFNLSIVCIVLAIITATFWVMEAQPAYRALQTVPKWEKGVKSINNPSIMVKWLFNLINQSKWLAIDIACTLSIVWLFHLGGLIGTTMGFAISNVISFSLFIARLKERRK